MIVYYDSGRKRLMRDCFLESGVPFCRLYRNWAAEKLDELTRGRIRPRFLLYPAPEPTGTEPLIVFDSKVTPAYLNWLCRRNPDRRIILWFWNPIPDLRPYRLIPRCVELWSYSPSDCRRLSLRENTPFYFDDAAAEADRAFRRRKERGDAAPRVFFAGREKGRSEAILGIGRLLEQNGAVCDFHFTKPGVFPAGKPERMIPYRALLAKIDAADCLLDYYTDPDAGLSLRAMESLFWRKKLITNSRAIRGYDFYDPNNVYLLGEESRTPEEFFREPYRDPGDAVRARYLLSNWIRRFEETGEK